MQFRSIDFKLEFKEFSISSGSYFGNLVKLF